MPASRNRLLAFTLIELLVVLAVISIIAAILLPAFFTARAKAHQVLCLSNLRQLGLALQQYAQDNDADLPSGAGVVASLHGARWAGPIFPYVRQEAVFQCPDDVTSGRLVTVAGVPHTLTPISYAYNSNLMGTTTASRGICGKSSMLTSPTVTVMLCETTAKTFEGGAFQPVADLQSPDEAAGQVSGNVSPGAGNGGFDAFTGTVIPLATGVMGRRASSLMVTMNGRHLDGSNFLFCDGHVKWLRPSSVSNGWMILGREQPTDCEDQAYFGEPAGTECADTWVATFSPI